MHGVILKPVLDLYPVGSAHIPSAKISRGVEVHEAESESLQNNERVPSDVQNMPWIHPLLSVTMAPILVQVSIISDWLSTQPPATCLPSMAPPICLHTGVSAICSQG